MFKETVQVIISKENPSVSVVIPSFDGYRGGNVPKLIEDIRKQTFQDFELILVKGVSPCSRAHNAGVQKAKGEIIVFFDDDIVLGNNRVVENLVNPIFKDKSIGITGTSQLIPPDANWFQRKCAKEFSRIQFPEISTPIESDMATHAAMAIRKDVFLKVGQENEYLMYGDDPDLRYRVRRAGYKIVIVPNTLVYHPPPLSLIAFLRTSFQRGKGAAHDFWYYPDLIYETPPATAASFRDKRSFAYRGLRFITHNLRAIIKGDFVFLSVRISYGIGYVINLLNEVIVSGLKQWFGCSRIKDDLIKYCDKQVKVIVSREKPLVSVIIPSLDGYRKGNVPKLLDDIKNQTIFGDIEVIIIKGVSPNGHARNLGVREAKGKYLVCIDDDVTLGNNKVIENLIAPFGRQTPNPKLQNPIGLTGASQLIPSNSSYLQKIAARQLPRTYFPIVDKITESDMVSHMCLAISTQLYKDIGWESDELKSGTDPDLRYRVRKAGYKVVVVPHTWAYHPLPETMTKILKMSYAKGKEAAWSQRHYPHLVYELAYGFVSDFKPQRSFVYRVFRSIAQSFQATLNGRLIFLSVRISYDTGYVIETVFGK
ncbi:MAG: glycosyltransferase [Planctomycetes bacterium]|nr:glycosyltransferase [Planctomycetota bacterium]